MQLWKISKYLFFYLFFFLEVGRGRLISNAPESAGCVTRASSENRWQSVEHNTRPSEYRPVQGRLGYLLFLFKWDRPRRITTTVVVLIVSGGGGKQCVRRNETKTETCSRNGIGKNKRSIIVSGPISSVVLHVVTPNDSSGPSRSPPAGLTLARTCRFWPSRIPFVRFLFSNKTGTKKGAPFTEIENAFAHRFSTRFHGVMTVLLKGWCFDRLSLSSKPFSPFSTRPREIANVSTT